MPDTPDYIVEVPTTPSEQESSDLVDRPVRSWLGVRFDCCHVYYRIYRNPEGTAYVGRCPHCCREVSVRIGPAGTNTRFFKAQ